jgi:hypothetical protein
MPKFTGTDLPKLKDTEDDTAVKKSILDLLDKINSVADAQYPVGYVYTQYPGTSDPATLFGGTWLNITSLYAGLFFRAEGGSSLAFNAGNQLDAFQGHNHTISSGQGSHNHTQDSHNHTQNSHNHSINESPASGGGNQVAVGQNPAAYPGNASVNGTTATNQATTATNQANTLPLMTADIITTQGALGTPRFASETRPVNTTIRIWQRSGGTLTTTTGTSVTMGIYDSGTNSNGSWIRFTDGTMQCWKDTIGPITMSSGPATGNLYYASVSATFPQQFISKPTITSQIGNRITGNISWVGWLDTTTTGVSGGELVSFVLNLQTYWQYIAIGKWR